LRFPPFPKHDQVPKIPAWDFQGLVYKETLKTILDPRPLQPRCKPQQYMDTSTHDEQRNSADGDSEHPESIWRITLRQALEIIGFLGR